VCPAEVRRGGPIVVFVWVIASLISALEHWKSHFFASRIGPEVRYCNGSLRCALFAVTDRQPATVLEMYVIRHIEAEIGLVIA
jgi:hypothetical protein